MPLHLLSPTFRGSHLGDLPHSEAAAIIAATQQHIATFFFGSSSFEKAML